MSLNEGEYGGRYVSLTPGHANELSEDECKQLEDAHILFGDARQNTYMVAGGLAQDWPVGCACPWMCLRSVSI